MFNPDTAPVSAFMPSVETAARSLKIVPITPRVHSDVEIETAIIALGRESSCRIHLRSCIDVDHIGGGAKQHTGGL
jgi:hypothetical protein